MTSKPATRLFYSLFFLAGLTPAGVNAVDDESFLSGKTAEEVVARAAAFGGNALGGTFMRPPRPRAPTTVFPFRTNFAARPGPSAMRSVASEAGASPEGSRATRKAGRARPRSRSRRSSPSCSSRSPCPMAPVAVPSAVPLRPCPVLLRSAQEKSASRCVAASSCVRCVS